MEITNVHIKKDWKKNIILFLASQSITLFGSTLVQYAIIWYITLDTQSGIMMTISIICGFVPAFIISPFAGVFADRYNRKILIILSDAFIAIATLILAILFLIGYDSLWLLFVISAIRSLGSGIQSPAVGAILPQLVPEDKLTSVNGTNGSIRALVMLISPMASGALLTFASIETIFFIDVVTAVLAIITLLVLMDIPIHAKALQQQKNSYFGDMQQGITYIKKHDFVKKLFVFFAVFFIIVTPVAFLTPLQVTRSFGNDVWRLTAIEIAYSLGMIFGGIIMASWGGFRNRIHTMMLSSFVIGSCTLALGFVPIFWIYLVFMSLIGVAMPFFNTPPTVIIQEKVEGDYLGRVFGVFGMIATSMMPLGMLVFGPISDIIKIEWLLIGTGLLLFLQGFILLGSKVLLEAGKPISKLLN